MQKTNLQNAKLTVRQVLEIRNLYEQGWTQRELAQKFEVSIIQIGRIVRREAWIGIETRPQEGARTLEMRRMAGNGLSDEPSADEIAESIRKVQEWQNTMNGAEDALRRMGIKDDDEDPPEEAELC